MPELTAGTGIALHEISDDLIVDALSGGGGGSFTFASTAATIRGLSSTSAVTPKSFAEAQVWLDVRSRGAVGDGVTFDRTVIQACIDELAGKGGGIVFLPAGRYRLDIPLWVKSNVELRGVGPASILYNDNALGPGGVTRADYNRNCCLFGLYNPAAISGGSSGTMVRNTIAVPAAGANVITRIQTTIDVAVGDWLILFNSAKGQNAQFVRQVIAINGNDLTLHKPLTDAAFSADAFLSKGAGYNVNFNAVDGTTVPMTLGITVNAAIRDLAVDCPAGYWIGRGGSVDCLIENVYVIDSGSLGYGSMNEHLTMRNVYGMSRNRFIEQTDGSRDCVFENMRAFIVAGFGYEDSDPVIWLGYGGVLDGFDVTDHTIRSSVGHINITQNCVTIRNGIYRITGASVNRIILLGATRHGITIENVTIDAVGQIHGDIMRVFEVSDVLIRNLKVNSAAGYVTGKCTIAVNTSGDGIHNVRIENVTDLNGQILYTGTVPTPDQLHLSGLSWEPTPDSVTAGEALELLGLATNVRSESAPLPYPPESGLWVDSILGHVAVYGGTALGWIPLAPAVADQNICCVLARFGVLLDAEQYTSGETWKNLGAAGAAYDGTMVNGPTTGLDGSHRFIAFDGVSSYASVPDGGLFDITTADDITILLVFKSASAATSRVLWGNKSSTPSTAAGFGMMMGASDATKVAMRFADGTTQVLATTATSWSTGTRTWVLGYRDHTLDVVGVAAVSDIDGTDVTTSDTTTGSAANASPVRVARAGTSSTYTQMDVYMLAAVKGVLNATQELTLDTYLAARFI